ncbi:uncharacterized protein LOC111398184 [Olea europaea var. sylvestris]|uniref:uncharacterized protein LOC111398184 n=1 Tax=Olea europaea var. sylvestris TaxID=158386 RepID=UPI000C1CCF30|nr:uncharacterized protein LOC111398184 [Olea europaea var. sylvestris]
MAQTLGSRENNLKEVNVITTRSSKVIEPTPKPRDDKKNPSNSEESTPSEEVVKNPSRVHFPQALKKHHVKKITFLIEHVSAMIEQKILPKYKDPGCPNVSCIIRNHVISQTLLDIGASVRIMPYDIYLSLGLGEMKHTSVSLQLADQSTIRPKGVVEDLLVQVDKFHYPIDFSILDIKVDVNVNSKILIILGRSFLATANALINCMNGLMKLSFGNITLDINIFHIMKQPEEDDEYHQTFMIDVLVQEEVPTIIDPDPLNSFLSNFEISIRYDADEYADICAAFDDLQDYGTSLVLISNELGAMQGRLIVPWLDAD